jgi:hypothetical protein
MGTPFLATFLLLENVNLDHLSLLHKKNENSQLILEPISSETQAYFLGSFQ